jgi:hypothetical protein
MCIWWNVGFIRYYVGQLSSAELSLGQFNLFLNQQLTNINNINQVCLFFINTLIQWLLPQRTNVIGFHGIEIVFPSLQNNNNK